MVDRRGDAGSELPERVVRELGHVDDGRRRPRDPRRSMSPDVLRRVSAASRRRRCRASRPCRSRCRRRAGRARRGAVRLRARSRGSPLGSGDEDLHASLPHLPRRLAGVPELVELGPVAEGVHAHPEALVLVHAELAVGGERLQRLLLEQEVGVVVEVRVDHLALEREEAARDPAVGHGRLLVELRHLVAVDVHLAEPARRVHAGHGADLAARDVLRGRGASMSTLPMPSP